MPLASSGDVAHAESLTTSQPSVQRSCGLATCQVEEGLVQASGHAIDGADVERETPTQR